MDLPTGARGALAVVVATALPLVPCGANPVDGGGDPAPASTCLAGADHVFMFGETAWSRARTGTDELQRPLPGAAGTGAVWPCAARAVDPTARKARPALEA